MCWGATRGGGDGERPGCAGGGEGDDGGGRAPEGGGAGGGTEGGEPAAAGRDGQGEAELGGLHAVLQPALRCGSRPTWSMAAGSRGVSDNFGAFTLLSGLRQPDLQAARQGSW
jgi:hypothetical protein